VITGLNRVFSHNGKEYHIQTEDLGSQAACFEVRVYDQGAVLWSKKVPYAEIVQKGLPKTEQEEALRSLMDKTLQTVQAAIAKGKLAG